MACVRGSGGEDAHFYTPYALGVFDGVGGYSAEGNSNPTSLSRGLLKSMFFVLGVNPRYYSQALMEVMDNTLDRDRLHHSVDAHLKPSLFLLFLLFLT